MNRLASLFGPAGLTVLLAASGCGQPASASSAVRADTQAVAAVATVSTSADVTPPPVSPTPSKPAAPTAAAELARPAASTQTPDATVRLFYELLAEKRYQDLRGVTTGDVFATIPDPASLADRTPAGDLTVERADVMDEDPSGDNATVAVIVSEHLGVYESTTRRYVGIWKLVRGPAGWLLAESNLRLE